MKKIFSINFSSFRYWRDSSKDQARQSGCKLCEACVHPQVVGGGQEEKGKGGDRRGVFYWVSI